MRPKVLFATELSSRDLNAFRQSCRLALDWNAQLEIVHVQDANPTIDSEKELQRFVPDDLAVSYNQTVLEGDAAEQILLFADDIDAKLIVLGTHGRSGMDRVFRGSVAEEVLRKSECPVMTIRDTANTTRLEKMSQILVPIDFSVHGYVAIHVASQIALRTSSSLTICYVDTDDHTADEENPHGSPEWDQRQKNLWTQLCKYVPTSERIPFAHHLLKGEAGKEICSYANTKPYDYIVIGTHGRSGLTRALMGSVAEYVVRHADQPVIAVKPSTKRAKLAVL